MRTEKIQSKDRLAVGSPEILSFPYKEKELAVSLKYSSRKTLGITVCPDKKIELTAPIGTSIASIQKVLERKSQWITSKLEELEKYKIREPKKNYNGGSTLKFLGREYLIKVIEIPEFEEEQIIKEKKLLKVYVHNNQEKQKIHLRIEDWYRNKALLYLAKKFEQCYQKIKSYNIARPFYYLRYMSRRWGSCTSKGSILLNPEILQFPSHCIEYIIMHELCHLKHNNHSKKFYGFLETVLPDWKDRAQAMDSFLRA